VMNTDNMTISGETIDYGPCAFIDAFDSAAVFSSIDHQGRYAFGNQPQIGLWNLTRLAETLLPLVDADGDTAVARVTESLHEYGPAFNDYWLAGMRRKLGLGTAHDGDRSLADDMYTALAAGSVDGTTFLRALPSTLQGDCAELHTSVAGASSMGEWIDRWQRRIDAESRSPDDIAARMRRTNPAYIPRNHQVEAVLAAATEGGDLSGLAPLLDAVTHPYDETRERSHFSTPAPADFGRYRTFCGT
jgi:serine/tyrosine/threonine adenylyltransferase